MAEPGTRPPRPGEREPGAAGRPALAWTGRHAGRRFERDDADVEGNARPGGGRGHGEIFRQRHGEGGGTVDVMAEYRDPARFDGVATARRRDQDAEAATLVGGPEVQRDLGDAWRRLRRGRLERGPGHLRDTARPHARAHGRGGD